MKTRAMWVIGLVAAITFVLCFKKDPAGFALIPAGNFQMGDALDDRFFPVHEEMVSAFYMAKYEVTEALWDEVRAWGASHGYADLPAGARKGATHPVHSINWYATVKWCNARSEREGLTPCYYKDAAQSAVYRTGAIDLDNTMVKWTANGYRLPTDAEWEKAARGGLIGKRFPWGDTISHQQANFFNDAKEPYQTGTRRFHPTYQTGKPGNEMYTSFTSPVGSFAPNGYGLYAPDRSTVPDLPFSHDLRARLSPLTRTNRENFLAFHSSRPISNGLTTGTPQERKLARLRVGHPFVR